MGMNDFAYLLLKEPLSLSPSDFIPVLTDPSEIRELIRLGARATLVGFGQTESGNFGIKYETQTTISHVNGNEVSMGGSGHDSCQGDSGGPAYAQLPTGEWRVFGVVSRGMDCGSGGEWGLMHSNICWVQEATGIDLQLNGLECPPSSSSPSEARPSNDPHPPGYDYGNVYGGGYIDYYGDPW